MIPYKSGGKGSLCNEEGQQGVLQVHTAGVHKEEAETAGLLLIWELPHSPLFGLDQKG